MKSQIPLYEWIFRSYVLHGIALFAIAWVALFGLSHRTPARTTVCEFVLQQQSERNDEKTNRIALNSAKAHGQHDPHDDPNKMDGAPRAQAASRRAQAASLQKKRAVARREVGAPASSRLEKRAVARRYQEPKRVGPPRSNAVASEQAVKVPAVKETEVKETEANETATNEPQANQSESQTRTRSFMREWLGRRLNTDRDTDNKAPSYAANASPDFGPYMNYLHRVLAKAWTPPGGNGGHCVEVLFDIHREGQISGLHIIRSCGNTQYDRAALQAVSQASPFHPLPAGAPSSVSIQYTFDYHVLHHH